MMDMLADYANKSTRWRCGRKQDQGTSYEYRDDCHQMNDKWVSLTLSEEETILLGRVIGSSLGPGDVVLLHGELGVGKTRLAKGIVSMSTGVDEDDVVSPTFTLVNRFDGRFPVYHGDLYRIESPHLDDVGIYECLGPGSAVVVEWAEKMPVVGGDVLWVEILYTSEPNSRKIIFEWIEHGSWAQRMAHVVETWMVGRTPAPKDDLRTCFPLGGTS